MIIMSATFWLDSGFRMKFRKSYGFSDFLRNDVYGQSYAYNTFCVIISGFDYWRHSGKNEKPLFGFFIFIRNPAIRYIVAGKMINALEVL